MVKTLRTALALIGVIAAALVLYAVFSDDVEPGDALPEPPAPSQGESRGKEEEDQPAYTLSPDFTAYDADGSESSLSDYYGVPIVLNFWASWCGPCKTEMPAFEAVAAEYDDDELCFIMLNMTGVNGETRSDAETFLDQGGYTFRVWFDENAEGYKAYGIQAFPTTVFIRSDGSIYGAVRGAMTEKKLRAAIDKLFEADS